MICLVHNTFHDLIHCKHILSSFSLLSENNKKRIHDRIYTCNGFLRLLRNRAAIISKMELQLSPFLLCNFRYFYYATYMNLGSHLWEPLQKGIVIRLKICDLIDGGEYILSHKSDFPFHISSFIAGPGIAEPDFKTIMHTESSEQFYILYVLTGPANHSGGVVEDDDRRNPAKELENIFQFLTDTFRVFPIVYLSKGNITERKGENEILQPCLLTINDEIRFSIICLGKTRIPYKLKSTGMKSGLSQTDPQFHHKPANCAV